MQTRRLAAEKKYPKYARKTQNQVKPQSQQVQQNQIVSLQKAVRKIQTHQELKHLDTFNSVPPTTAGVVILLNDMATGDTTTTRDGNDITCTSIQWRMRILSDVDAIKGFMVRHILFWDSAPQGASPPVGSVLDISVITSNVLAPYHRDFQKRYKILYDKTFCVNPDIVTTIVSGSPATATGSKIVADQGKRSLSRVTKFIAASAGIVNMESNALYSIIFTDATTDAPIMQCGYRLYFKDD